MRKKYEQLFRGLVYLKYYKDEVSEQEYFRCLRNIIKKQEKIPNVSADVIAKFLSKENNYNFCLHIDERSISEIKEYLTTNKKKMKKVVIESTLFAAGLSSIIAVTKRIKDTSAANTHAVESTVDSNDLYGNDEWFEEDNDYDEYSEDVINKDTLGHDYGTVINKETLGHDYGYDILEKREAKKKKVLSKYCKCKSIDDILKRQRQLEKLHLTDEDKIYTKCPLSPEIQWFIYEQSIRNNIPPDFTFSIIGVETRGEYNSTGKATYNSSNNSYDLGLTQQNSKSRLPEFQKKYNLTYDEAFNYLKNNDFLNVVSAFLYYDEIKSHFREFDPYEFAGCYNGWLNWRGKKYSIQYVNLFDDYYDHKFTKHHDVTSNIKTK